MATLGELSITELMKTEARLDCMWTKEPALKGIRAKDELLLIYKKESKLSARLRQWVLLRCNIPTVIEQKQEQEKKLLAVRNTEVAKKVVTTSKPKSATGMGV